MADSYTANLNLRKPEVGAATDNWGNAPLGLNGDMDLIDAVFAPGGAGTPVGLNVGTGKTLALGGTILGAVDSVINALASAVAVAASRFTIRDATDATKIAKFDVAGIATATTRTLTVPNADLIIVGTATTQTLTNKTLTDCTANTQVASDSTTKLATTAMVQAAILAAGLTICSTGDVKLTLKTVADPGWLMMADQTIGNAGSGATYANAAAQALYTLLWTNVSNTYAPVTGGRGASATADWTANKRIALTKVLGRALAAAGTGSGLTARTLGQTLGAETHTLVADEMPSHTHQVPRTMVFGADIVGGVGSYLSASLPLNGDSGATGGDDPHNNMQPTSFLNVMVKL